MDVVGCCMQRLARDQDIKIHRQIVKCTF